MTSSSDTDTPKRVSRFTHAVTPTAIRLQARDIKILEALYRYRLLTTSQLGSLFFSSQNRAERRLRQLYDAELIERIYRPVAIGSAELLYVLDKEGVNLVAKELGIDRGEVQTARTRAKALKPLFLDHFIEVNQFRLSVTLAAPVHHHHLIFWKYDHELQNRNRQGVLISDRVTDPEHPTQKIPVTPDGFFGLETPRGNAYFFVEVDRATMDNPRFKRKMRGYARYWLDGVYEEKWGYKTFRVLTSTTPRRVPNLLKTTSQLSETQLLSVFHFTEQHNISPERVFDPIWYVPNQDGRRSVV